MLIFLIVINFSSDQLFLGPGAGILFICLALIHNEKNSQY